MAGNGKFFVQDSSAWNTIQHAYVLDGGTWVRFYSYLYPPTSLAGVDTGFCDGDLTTEHHNIHLTWSNYNSEWETNIYRDGVLINTVGAGGDSYDDTSVDTGTYEYFIAHGEDGRESTRTSSIFVVSNNHCGI